MLKTKRYILLTIGIAIGATIGYAYWYYYGCQNGCSLKSSWWKMSLYGALFGYLGFDTLNEYIFKNKINTN